MVGAYADRMYIDRDIRRGVVLSPSVVRPALLLSCSAPLHPSLMVWDLKVQADKIIYTALCVFNIP